MTLAKEEGVTIAILLFLFVVMSVALGLCYCKKRYPQKWYEVGESLGFGDANARIQQRQAETEQYRGALQDRNVTEDDMVAKESLSAEDQIEYAKRMREKFKDARKERQPVDIKTYTEGLNALDAMLSHDTFKRMPLLVHSDTNLPDLRGDVQIDTSRTSGNKWGIQQSSKLETIRERGADVRVQSGMILPKPIYN